MTRQLTSGERQTAAIILVAIIIAGITLTAPGRSDTLGVHGVNVMLLAGGYSTRSFPRAIVRQQSEVTQQRGSWLPLEKEESGPHADRAEEDGFCS